MLVSVLLLLALGEATTPEPEHLKTFQAEFRPLKRSERSYAKLGPAGPFYPQRASDARASGYGLIKCQVADDGDLTKCKLVNETPWNSNFAPAARIMAERKRIFVTGATTGATILVQVPFVLGGPAAVEP
ncbi:MAG: energy transducer TonB [Alphaproteobacteria bacterium]|nr:energy transducer TonB [Alphaproteobacteria bacterium]MBU1513851.1 energy transducer TonB [Alphaproteobacteria bacterium]MBU2094504.1 energy transducer TonB [Alphaproteobacteria bacterium]MBU2151235.1 energy transducer TonB [Alphaproteobacteria bacterium]MBU2310050.1 energy transducer TonB [Alphaproteobacteria bacterium]